MFAPYQLELFNPRRAPAAPAPPRPRAAEPSHEIREANDSRAAAAEPSHEIREANDSRAAAAEPSHERARPTPPPAEEVLPRADSLARRIAADLGARVRLVVNDNRSTMVSYQREAGELTLRLHHMFLDAPDEVVRALADYAGRGRRRAGKVIDAYVAGSGARIRAVPRRAEPLEPVGKCFDLLELFEGLNRAHFQSGIRARIGWGRGITRRRRKSIRLGVYDHAAREIRIHPALDKPDVPRFFVEYIVFHEMLHQLFPSARHDGRHVHHPRAFKDREKAFPLYDAAIAWEKQHLAKLLGR